MKSSCITLRMMMNGSAGLRLARMYSSGSLARATSPTTTRSSARFMKYLLAINSMTMNARQEASLRRASSR